MSTPAVAFTDLFFIVPSREEAIAALAGDEMKRPANLVYAPDEVPPLHVTAFNAIQHVGLIAINRCIRCSCSSVRRLAGFMLPRNADRVRSEAQDGTATVHFHFDH